MRRALGCGVTAAPVGGEGGPGQGTRAWHGDPEKRVPAHKHSGPGANMRVLFSETCSPFDTGYTGRDRGRGEEVRSLCHGEGVPGSTEESALSGGVRKQGREGPRLLSKARSVSRPLSQPPHLCPPTVNLL